MNDEMESKRIAPTVPTVRMALAALLDVLPYKPVCKRILQNSFGKLRSY